MYQRVKPFHTMTKFRSVEPLIITSINPDVAEANQKKIVEDGGLPSLLTLLKNSQDETTHRVAAGAIANLAMNGKLSHVFFCKNSTTDTSIFFFPGI